MKDWRGLPRDPAKPGDMLSPADLAWRIGAADSRPPGPDGDAEGEPAATPATPVSRRRPRTAGRHAHQVERPAVRAALLLRDAAGLLFGAVAILLIVQLATGNGGQPAGAPATAQGSVEPSEVANGGAAPESSPGTTIGPVVDPGLLPVLEASPTPVPIATPAPPTQRPRATPRPTPRPTPTAAPTPSPSPSPTPTPPVIESIVCNPVSGSASAPVAVTCGVTMNVQIVSWSWDFGDPGSPGSTSSGAHSYASRGSYTISVTVTAAGGTDTATLSYVVQ